MNSSSNSSSSNDAELLLWGFIHVDPLGEISLGDFLVNSSNLDNAKLRFHSSIIQTFITTSLLVLFTRNTWYSIRLLRHNSRSVDSWCCFLQAFMGVISNVIIVTSSLPGGPSCRMCNMVYSAGLTVSSICVSSCLLHRAYIISNHNRLLLTTGILLMLPLPGTIWIFWVESRSRNTDDYACITQYPTYLPWFRFVIDVLINLLFSVIFLNVVIQQYRTLGHECWRRLQSDGLVYLLCVVASNIMCASIVALKPFGGFSEMMFLFDWMVTSTLLIHQYQGMRKAFSVDSRPSVPRHKRGSSKKRTV